MIVCCSALVPPLRSCSGLMQVTKEAAFPHSELRSDSKTRSVAFVGMHKRGRDAAAEEGAGELS